MLTVLLIAASASYAGAQESHIKKCDSTIKGGQYKLVSEGKAVSGDDLLIFIVVKADNINEAFMRQVAARLKARYCNEARLTAVISDRKKFADLSVLSDYRNSKGKIVRMRGYYSLDRTTGKEELEFSKKLGNPTTEVKVIL